MKYFVRGSILLMFVFCLFSCTETGADFSSDQAGAKWVHNPESVDSSEQGEHLLPMISFVNKVHDFKVIYQGEKVEHKFKFTNSGKAELVISSTKTSCGCTVSDYPKKPIMPGETSFIKVVFDSENKEGYFHKAITIIANTYPNKHVLEIIGKILIS